MQKGEVHIPLKDYAVSISVQLLVFQLFLLWAWAAYNSASAIRMEHMEKTHDFFKMLPLSAYQKAMGILLGKNCYVLLFAGINFLFLFLFASYGMVQIHWQMQTFALIIAMTLFVNFTALLSSTYFKKTKRTTSLASIIILFMFFMPMLLSFIGFLFDSKKSQGISLNFYGINMPLILFVSFIAFYFSAWLFAGILRRFTYEEEPLFSLKGAILFFLGYVFVLWGSFWGVLTPGKPLEYYAGGFLSLLGFSFLPLLFLPFGLMKDYYKYFEFAGINRLWDKTKKEYIWVLLKYSNLTYWLIMFFIWAGVVLAIAVKLNISLMIVLHFIFVFFTFYLFYLLLGELHVCYSPSMPKIKNLLIAVFICALFLPMILSGIFSNTILMRHSILGYVGYFFTFMLENKMDYNLLIEVWLLNIFLCIFPVFWIINKYTYIFNLRQKKEKIIS